MFKIAVLFSLILHVMCNIEECVDCSENVLDVSQNLRSKPFIIETTLEEKPSNNCCPGCGYRNEEGTGNRIMSNHADSEAENGDRIMRNHADSEAEYGEFPWVVIISRKVNVFDEVKYRYLCGGSLIHPSVVLTVAHCVSKKETVSLNVRAGEYDIRTESELFPHQDRQVSEYIVHEEYYKAAVHNDVALLFLVKPFVIGDNVNTICLPPQNQNFDSQRCFATGFGKDSNDGRHQNILKKIDLPIVPKCQCIDEIRKTRLGERFQLHDSLICAGGELGKDTCKGDGGSALVCPISNTDNRYYQVGMVAWGLDCGNPIPAFYVNVPLFRNWIDEKLQMRGFDNTHYTPV